MSPQAQGGESEQPAHVADEGTVLSRISMVRYSPSNAYVLNDNIYLAKVAKLNTVLLRHTSTASWNSCAKRSKAKPKTKKLFGPHQICPWMLCTVINSLDSLSFLWVVTHQLSRIHSPCSCFLQVIFACTNVLSWPLRANVSFDSAHEQC